MLLVSDENKTPLFIMKTISFNSADIPGLEQARTEFSIASKLGEEHPNIARGIVIKEYNDSESKTNNVEMLFEFGGQDLLELNEIYKLTSQQILEISVQTANAMAFAHSKGIFHSDLKAQNIVYRDGVAKIIDFGVSADLKSKTVLEKYLTRITGKIIGMTQCYCPP